MIKIAVRVFGKRFLLGSGFVMTASLVSYIFFVFNDIILFSLGGLFITKVFFLILFLSSFRFNLDFKFLAYLFFLLSVVALYIGVSLLTYSYNNFSIQQAVKFIITFLFPLLGAFYLKRYPENLLLVTKAVLFSAFFASLWKFFFILCFYFAPDFVAMVFPNINARLIGGKVVALNTGNQLLVLLAALLTLTLFCLRNFWWRDKTQKLACRDSGNKYILLYIVFFINTLLSGSVFFIIITLASSLMVLFVMSRLSVKALWAFLSPLAVISLFFLFEYTVDVRGEGFERGVQARIYQLKMLGIEVLHDPFLGKGFGYFISDYVRNNSSPYLYEVQFFSLIMHYGLLGILIIAVLLCGIYMVYGKTASFFVFSSLVMLVVLSSFFNPYMFGTYAGLAYLIILLTSIYYGKYKKDEVLNT
ncbi:hypothetical protein J8402_06530 [Chromohalobacter israelensis]|uniref:hypothetical protein n=1 Tax=Chromohalobacter israelensis TaxID=141390 RepID=UPI003AF41FE4